MAPNVTSSNREMPKAWYNGHYHPAKQEGNKFYIEVNGVKIDVDKNDLFSMNSNKKLDKSFEEQKANHTKWEKHWLDLKDAANLMYENATVSYKNAYKKFSEITQGKKIDDLEGSKKEEAKAFYADMRNSTSAKIRGESDSIFYGRLAVDEMYSINNVNNLQTIAKYMSQS